MTPERAAILAEIEIREQWLLDVYGVKPLPMPPIEDGKLVWPTTPVVP